jgi:hypothetical protein
MSVEFSAIASKFLANVFGSSTNEPVYLASLPNSDARDREVGERPVATRELETIEAFVRKWDRQDRALYFCTATVKAGSTTRSKATIAELNGLHVDIDFKSIACTPTEAEQKLQHTFLMPSKVVHSGGGLHAYWLFKESLPATPNAIERIERLLKLLADHLGGDPACAEASRLMRLPGTHNTKGGAWTEVRLIEDRALRYEVFELEDWLEIASPLIHGKQTQQVNSFANPWLAVASRFSNKPPIDVEERLSAMRYQGEGDSGIHTTQVSVTAALLNRGHAVDEAVSVVLDATRAAAGAYGERWNWHREERTIRAMCGSWLAKHPDIVREQTNSTDKQTTETPPPPPALLRPYVARPFAEIPPRRWLHAGHYIRQQVVMTVGPGGYGKTSLIICNGIEMAIRQGLLGTAPTEGPLRVGYWNAEDPEDEIERRIAAVCIRHEIDQAALQGQLFLGSKISGGRRIAMLDRNGNVSFDDKLLTEVTKFVRDAEIDCVIFDPLIAFHRVPESDNGAMEQVVKAFEEIAASCNCCIELSQHTRKSSSLGAQGELTADDSRGASSAVNAARSVRVLNRMTGDEAKLPKIAPEERRHYLRVSRDKTNLAPPGKANWIHLVPVQLPNANATHPGDNVQAAEAWDYPQPFDNVSADDMRWLRSKVAGGTYRKDPRSDEWVGKPLADRLGLDPDEDRQRLQAILTAWFKNGVLNTEIRKVICSHHSQQFFLAHFRPSSLPSMRCPLICNQWRLLKLSR